MQSVSPALQTPVRGVRAQKKVLVFMVTSFNPL